MSTEQLEENNYRYERKFVLPALSLAEIRAWIRSHPAHFVTEYPARQVNNLYLDSDDLGNFQQHIAGIPQRSKTRIRWYGSHYGSISTACLEIKQKAGQLGSKQYHPLKPFEHHEECHYGHLVRQIVKDNHLSVPTSTQIPQLLNYYTRAYWRTTDNHFRLTVDSGLCYVDVRFPLKSHKTTYQDNAIILELKYSAQHEHEIEAITAHFPWRLEKMSKYVSGINWINHNNNY